MSVDESRINVLGDVVNFWLRNPSNNPQRPVLIAKYLTEDCLKCKCCIPKTGAIEVVQRATRETNYKWIPPRVENIEGLCLWSNEYPKVLVMRIRGSRKCEFFKDT
jgi:hypothetical protein